MTPSVAIALCGALLSIGTVLVGLGRVLARLDQIDERQREHRDESRAQSERLTTAVTVQSERLARVERDVEHHAGRSTDADDTLRRDVASIGERLRAVEGELASLRVGHSPR